MKKILICDGDRNLHEELTPYYEKEHIQVISKYDATSAREYMKIYPVDLLLLNTDLPDKNGISFVGHLRRCNLKMPIIFLSQAGEELDRILGLSIGADDYIVKPFYPREVVLRSLKLMDRDRKSEKEGQLFFQNLTMNKETLACAIDGIEVKLTALEFALLCYFLENKGKVLSRNQLLFAVWGYSYEGDTRTVDSLVKRIRNKLKPYPCEFDIQTVYGVGYQLKA